ncbi:ESPR-type extended signal peptide-containing protein [Actinobacillus equuli]|uniref:ESPR-type extended signal peptide-containing protein n=1 Tax=Actinobacillus equuli TaxID=718 RepID=UPI0024436331|nr:ESPR-type extended signal peptide-containing protein [Actinobacillus equuli]WGE75433.1 ESPR-type extended signal peptide-containing protein [Actinobacillus equuli subsp. haemolyticus]
MNKIFKVIWNHTTQSFVVVSELTRAQGKKSSTDLIVDTSKYALAKTILIGTMALTATENASGAYTLRGGTIASLSGTVVIYDTWGTPATAGFHHSVAIGSGVQANGVESVSIGNNTLSGAKSVAIGNSSNASGIDAVALGQLARNFNTISCSGGLS